MDSGPHRAGLQRRRRADFPADLRRPCANATRGHAGTGRRRRDCPGSGGARSGDRGDRVVRQRRAAEITATPALDAAIAEIRPAIRIVLAGVLLLFCTAVASVATVQLARAARRRREMTVRAALGATPARLAWHWLTETAVIGIGGGILGVAGAQLLIGAFPAILPADFPRLSDITLDWPVAVGSAAATFAAIAACALVPALQARRIDLVRSLAEDSLAPVGGGARTRVARVRAVIMAGQVAIACILLIGAVLVGRSLQALIDIDRGYDPGNLLTARLPLPSGPTYGASSALLQGIRDRLQALPGVTHAAFGNALPLVSAGGMTGLNVRLPRDPSTIAKAQALHRTVDPEYLRRNGIAVASRPPADRQRQRDVTARARGEQVVRGLSISDPFPFGRRLPLSFTSRRVGYCRRRGRHETGRAADRGLHDHSGLGQPDVLLVPSIRTDCGWTRLLRGPHD